MVGTTGASLAAACLSSASVCRLCVPPPWSQRSFSVSSSSTERTQDAHRTHSDTTSLRRSPSKRVSNRQLWRAGDKAVPWTRGARGCAGWSASCETVGLNAHEVEAVLCELSEVADDVAPVWMICVFGTTRTVAVRALAASHRVSWNTRLTTPRAKLVFLYVLKCLSVK